MFISWLFWLAEEVSWLAVEESLKIKVNISETRFLSFFKTFGRIGLKFSVFYKQYCICCIPPDRKKANVDCFPSRLIGWVTDIYWRKNRPTQIIFILSIISNKRWAGLGSGKSLRVFRPGITPSKRWRFRFFLCSNYKVWSDAFLECNWFFLPTEGCHWLMEHDDNPYPVCNIVLSAQIITQNLTKYSMLWFI